MNFSDYQLKARETAVYPNIGKCLYYPTLGLSGEAGESLEKFLNMFIGFGIVNVKVSHISELVKKMYRDENGILSDERKDAIKKELGDVLWYIAMVSFECGLDMNDVAETNIAKLHERKVNGKLHGSGDNR